MDACNNRKNWIAVGEVVRLLKEPVAVYTDHIVNKFHRELSSRLPSGECTNPTACLTKKKPGYLCIFCKLWYDELAKSHRNTNKGQIKWRENCDTSKWPTDPWEVAKFFMPVLGNHKITTKDSTSTDLSSLLNVLAWVEDAVFAPDRRLDRNLVENCRTNVRNLWAHAPNQKLTEANLNRAFDIANHLMSDLEKVFGCNEVKKCLKDIVLLEKNGLTNVNESERNIQNLLAVEIGANVRRLEKKVAALEERMETLEVFSNKKGNDGLKSCIPDKPPMFIGRETKEKEIICSIVENGCGIVSIVGGPGFGKSSLAVQVSHDLRNKHDIVVIFSFLSNSSTVSDAIQCLCNDVGVNPGEDSKSSLMIWLKRVEEKVVLVMDNIEQLLEDDVKSQFIELLLTLRKNSREHLQILATTRTELLIPNETTKNHHVLELDKKSSVELLKEYCPSEEVSDEYLSELADLCGCVPLALCIVAALIPYHDDVSELIECLKENPMEVLQDSSARCVQKAIEFSFQSLSHEDQKAFVRLSVFSGSFKGKSAEEVIERIGSKTPQFLQNLVARSLIQRRSDKRFVIHSLIRWFLADCNQFQDEKTIAKRLMVEHFLKKCYSLTMDSYSDYNGFTNAREEFRKDAHNVEKTLKISTQNQANLKPDILEILVCSDIYKSLSMFFYKFSRDFLPQTVLRDFDESCIKVAESRNEVSIQIAFQCLVADQDGRKSAWKSPEYINRLNNIAEMFRQIKTSLTNDRFLLMYFYDFYVRYMSDVNDENTLPDLREDDFSLSSEMKDLSPMTQVVELHILMDRGYLHKKCASRMYRIDKEISTKHMICAESCYSQAFMIGKKWFGNHEITCTIQKQFGDFYFYCRNHQLALSYYSEAIKLRKKLKLDSNEQFVFLLKNYGNCLSIRGRFDEAVENLKEALDVAEKLADKNTVCRARVHYELSRTYRYWQPDCQKAAVYAKSAMQMQDLLYPSSVENLECIIAMAERNMVTKNAQESSKFLMFQN